MPGPRKRQQQQIMEVYNLPQDIFSGGDSSGEPIIMHHYEAKTGSFKGRSILHKNAISLVINGRKTMHFAETTVHVNEKEFHFLSSGNCLASMDLSGQQVFRSILVFFDDKVLTDFFVKYDALIRRNTPKEKIAAAAYVSVKKDAFIDHYIDSLLLMFRDGQPISGQMKSLKFEELMLYLLEKHPAAILSFQKKEIRHFDDLQIRKTMEANITNNLKVDELAFLCNTSLSTFKRRFEKIYHCSPNKWLLLRRMEIAARLLEDHHEKPGEIFHQLGYENHSSFTQSFRQVYGVTPKAYQLQKLNVGQQVLDE